MSAVASRVDRYHFGRFGRFLFVAHIHRDRSEPISERRDTRINDRIRAREVRLVGAGGEQLGVRALPEALSLARAQELDLVEVAAQAQPPVCKIMDWGKHLYEESQRAKESKKKQTQIIVKEMKFRPKIDTHDFETKKRHVTRFLEDGAKVKVTIMFRGREMTHTELGRKILDELAADLVEIAAVESKPTLDGRTMIMVLTPTRKDVPVKEKIAEPVGDDERRSKIKGKGRRRRDAEAAAGAPDESAAVTEESAVIAEESAVIAEESVVIAEEPTVDAAAPAAVEEVEIDVVETPTDIEIEDEIDVEAADDASAESA